MPLDELKLENLKLKKTNLELQVRLIQLEHQSLTQQIQELENARPVSDAPALQPAE